MKSDEEDEINESWETVKRCAQTDQRPTLRRWASAPRKRSLCCLRSWDALQFCSRRFSTRCWWVRWQSRMQLVYLQVSHQMFESLTDRYDNWLSLICRPSKAGETGARQWTGICWHAGTWTSDNATLCADNWTTWSTWWAAHETRNSRKKSTWKHYINFGSEPFKTLSFSPAAQWFQASQVQTCELPPFKLNSSISGRSLKAPALSSCRSTRWCIQKSFQAVLQEFSF